MIRKIHTLLAMTCALIATTSFATPAAPHKDSVPKNMQPFINYMVTRYHFNRSTITQLLEHAKYMDKAVELLHHPFEAKPWDYYREHFVTRKRIRNGVRYWQQNQQILATVAQKYQVDPSVILGIIGVESHYGKRTGNFPALDTLSTLGFKQNSRQHFFRFELRELFLLARKNQLAITKINGSYAGALGIPQFMPSAYLAYGVNGSGNKMVDLLHNNADAIASVANYLRDAGWKKGQPVAIPAILSANANTKHLISKRGVLNTTIGKLQQHGIKVAARIKPNTRAALIVMQSKHSKQYWVIFNNFRAIMHYNPRTNYALAVYLLSQQVKQHYEQRAS